MATPQTNPATISAPSDATRETVLLVEDHDTIRKLLALGLESRGYRVLAAANGEEALGIASQESGVIDLLLTDIVMPGMNGRELAEALSVTRPETRILFTSAYAHDKKVLHGIDPEHGAFIAKPYLADALVEKIGEVLHADASA